MKLLLFIVFTTLSSGMFSQRLSGPKKRKLSFDDFRGEIGVSTAAAVSSVIIRYEIVSQSIWTGRIKIKIFAAFDRSSSWIKPEFKSPPLLAHEQGHFDITEIFSRKLQKKVDAEIKGVKDFSQKFQQMYDDLYNEHYQYQTQYEIDTDNGRHEENQEKYNTLIREMLL
ncbi:MULTISPECIES: hypothetical protein [Chryseobacterium]|uniref:DUF922 domain-containing protein n=1 Tax=Chryseobacterium camelliae TaxID=1265445 RepID=A0ABU0TL43_9FLAO|nr:MULTISPECIES: hypothetical protein [Chryseobacterium]MDT3408376.1 hypothetical protein [Pseudacidovorax intermedius]MDQ1097767.1 hypothetical protein [Chryseobacterium camelliae]MDQ1101701.1 hypothetical protein [Chryseobacterium sp. SORGH_AS_1048]MDR6085139.1 hypothetical protein [Chryseobacterium sp. SORGH_AS_0909]MDR6129498.1 hypothetical protein [Chryseobacterium sp. SORGH_AS_1175]